MDKCTECNRISDIYAKKRCRSCYRKFNNEANKRYQKNKDSLDFKRKRSVIDKRFRERMKKEGLLAGRMRVYYKRWISKEENRVKKSYYDAKWRHEINPEAYKLILTRAFDKRYFSGARNLVFSRYDSRCAICKLTNDEHLYRYSHQLSIHHIDGKGRNVHRKEKNNSVDNLILLCKQCHGRVELTNIDLSRYVMR